MIKNNQDIIKNGFAKLIVETNQKRLSRNQYRYYGENDD